MEGTSSANELNKTKRRNRPRGRKPENGKKEKSSKGGNRSKTAVEEPEKEPRYLEIVKLTRRYIPITINGLAVEKIIQVQTENQPNVLKSAKAEIVANHVLRLIKRDLKQPLYLSFMIPPSDPDFPFDLDVLKFNLTVPPTYPRGGKELPTIVVLNSDIPRGFSINIERGFKEIATIARLNKLTESDIKLVDGRGLLSQVNTLNKYLEEFLKQEKRQTMKFITFKHTDPTPSSQISKESTPVIAPPTPPPEPPTPNVSSETVKLRNRYIDEMCTKLSRNVKLFNKSASEQRYKVEIPIAGMKVPWLWSFQNNKAEIILAIPMTYPEVQPNISIPTNFSTNLLVANKPAIEKAKASLIKITQEAKAFERNFKANTESWLSRNHPVTLLDALNFVSNNLSLLGSTPNQYTRTVELVDQFKELQETETVTQSA